MKTVLVTGANGFVGRPVCQRLVEAGWRVRAAVRDGLQRAGRSADARFMVTPVAINPFAREVVVDLGDRYEKGNLWFEPLPHFRPAGFGMPKGLDDPEAQQALQSPRARASTARS